MTHTVEVESVRTLDTESISSALYARGLACEAVSSTLLRVSGAGSLAALARDVQRAIESWIGDRGLALVPQPIDAEHLLLRPPTA